MHGQYSLSLSVPLPGVQCGPHHVSYRCLANRLIQSIMVYHIGLIESVTMYQEALEVYTRVSFRVSIHSMAGLVAQINGQHVTVQCCRRLQYCAFV